MVFLQSVEEGIKSLCLVIELCDRVSQLVHLLVIYDKLIFPSSTTSASVPCAHITFLDLLLQYLVHFIVFRFEVHQFLRDRN